MLMKMRRARAVPADDSIEAVRCQRNTDEMLDFSSHGRGTRGTTDLRELVEG